MCYKLKDCMLIKKKSRNTVLTKSICSDQLAARAGPRCVFGCTSHVSGCADMTGEDVPILVEQNKTEIQVALKQRINVSH